MDPNVINADNQKRDADLYEKLSGTATQVEHVTVTSEDATNGHQTADCEVTLKFVTVDETVIHPESVQMGQQQVKFDLQATKEGDINSAVKTRTGFDPVQLSCTVLPDCSSDALHTPYNREVIWSVSDTDVASISQTGLLAPNPNAQWIKDAEHVAPYTGTKTIKAIATTVDGQKVGETTVVLNYAARCIEMPETETLDLVLTMTGRRNAPTYTFGDMPAETGDCNNISGKTTGYLQFFQYICAAGFCRRNDPASSGCWSEVDQKGVCKSVYGNNSGGYYRNGCDWFRQHRCDIKNYSIRPDNLFIILQRWRRRWWRWRKPQLKGSSHLRHNTCCPAVCRNMLCEEHGQKLSSINGCSAMIHVLMHLNGQQFIIHMRIKPKASRSMTGSGLMNPVIW